MGQSGAVFIFILIFGRVCCVSAQESSSPPDHGRTLTVQAGFSQLKDAFNYGLVYNGGEIHTMWSCWNRRDRSVFSYQGGFGLGMNGQVGPGLIVSIKPVNLSWVTSIGSGQWTLGGYMMTDYRWQLYPLLQSGHMFWMTTMEVGPKASVALPIGKRQLLISLAVSLAGVTSRPRPSTETYFYSLAFSDVIRNAHQRLTFGMSDRFNHTLLALTLVPLTSRRMTAHYLFEYLGYYPEPAFHYLRHAISLSWRLGK